MKIQKQTVKEIKQKTNEKKEKKLIKCEKKRNKKLLYLFIKLF